MAKVKNITPDTLTLFRADAPPVVPGGEVTVRDENFVDRAWPKSTWEVTEPPALEGDLSEYDDVSTDDAWLWAVPEVEPEPAFDPGAHTVDQVVAHLAAADDTERVRVIEAEAAGKARKTITEWSE